MTLSPVDLREGKAKEAGFVGEMASFAWLFVSTLFWLRVVELETGICRIGEGGAPSKSSHS